MTRSPGGYAVSALRGRLGIRRLRVVDEADAADLADGSSRCGTPGKRAQRLRDRLVADAERAGRRGRGRGVLAVVLAGDPRLGRQLVVGRELDLRAAPGTGRSRAERPRRRPPPGSRRSAASRRGSPRRSPWRSRWSGVRLRSTATRGRKDSMSSSWKLDSSQTTHASGAMTPSSAAERPPDVAGDRDRPAGGAEDRSEELARRRLAVRPGHPEHGLARQEPRAELDLAPDGSPRARAASTRGASLGTPGALHDVVHAVEERGIASAPRTTSTPAARSLPASPSPPRSTPTTRTPRRASASAPPRRSGRARRPEPPARVTASADQDANLEKR